MGNKKEKVATTDILDKELFRDNNYFDLVSDMEKITKVVMKKSKNGKWFIPKWHSTKNTLIIDEKMPKRKVFGAVKVYYEFRKKDK